MSEPLWCEIRQHYCRCQDFGRRCEDYADVRAELDAAADKFMEAHGGDGRLVRSRRIALQAGGKMTEEEATKKWCPMARMPQTTSEPSPSSNYGASCIGTACMMWRWDNVPNPAYKPHELMQHWPTISLTIQSETDGHCGLAHG